jgi:poly(hydroxyalkanoate) depolymerase family esterase
MKTNEAFLAQMREATELLRTSGPAAATAAIQRALGLHASEMPGQSSSAVLQPGATEAGKEKSGGRAYGAAVDNPMHRFKHKTGMPWLDAMAGQEIEDVDVRMHPSARSHAASGAAASSDGRFLSGSYDNPAGTRAYKLYVPSAHGEAPLPLIVMLHGCKQNPDDFAAGTAMNRLADEHKCLVLYPAQSVKANGSNCWQWFNPPDQKRGMGEPSIIADMTRQIMRDYPVDSKRVYVAGLSAGGAMASILAATYPDIFAAAAVHSGLPAGSAHDVASAFSVMKNGAAMPSGKFEKSVPVIVFHGDRDHTVHPGNGDRVLMQFLGPRDATCRTEVTTGKSDHGRGFTRTVYLDREGNAIAEKWTIHGSGHAWSGGSKAGSYTDGRGPDASAEMVRFFLAHPGK